MKIEIPNVTQGKGKQFFLFDNNCTKKSNPKKRSKMEERKKATKILLKNVVSYVLLFFLNIALGKERIRSRESGRERKKEVLL